MPYQHTVRRLWWKVYREAGDDLERLAARLGLDSYARGRLAARLAARPPGSANEFARDWIAGSYL